MGHMHHYRQHFRKRRRVSNENRRRDQLGNLFSGFGMRASLFLAIILTAMAAEGFVAHRSGLPLKQSSVTPSTRPGEQNSIFENICERRNWSKSCHCDRCNPAATKASRSAPLRRLSMSTAGGDDGSLDAAMITRQRKERTDSAIQNLMARHDPILLFASRLLPPNKAKDASALYAWCRRLDEICDSEENSGDPELVQRQLDVWQKRFENLWSSPEECARESASASSSSEATAEYTEDDYLMDLALKECIDRYQYLGNKDERQSLLSRKPFDDMINGMKADAVGQRRIQDMDELELYAYQVAGTVGLMLLPLLLTPEGNGGNNKTTEATFRAVETAKEPAICLGKAIQLVNILRDATQDAKLGRMYLPRDMLRDEGLAEQNEAELLREASSGSNTPAPDGYKRVVRKVSDRAHVLLARAEDGRSTLPAPLGPLLVQVIVELYRDYLQELERRGYDNLGSKSNGQDRVKISTLRKFQASLRAATKVFF